MKAEKKAEDKNSKWLQWIVIAMLAIDGMFFEWEITRTGFAFVWSFMDTFNLDALFG